MFWGDDGKCLCLRARAATFSSWQESCPAAGCCSFDPQSNLGLLTLKLSWTGVETFPSAFGPQEQKELTL